MTITRRSGGFAITRRPARRHIEEGRMQVSALPSSFGAPMTPLRDLLARCEKASGPDRDLDLAIAMATGTGSFSRSATFEQLEKVMRSQDQDGGLYEDKETGLTCVRARFIQVPLVTSSIDAALALVERMIPGCNWIIGKGRTRPDEPLFGAQILREGPIRDEVIGEWELEASAPLALVAALLKSLIAGEEKGNV